MGEGDPPLILSLSKDPSPLMGEGDPPLILSLSRASPLSLRPRTRCGGEGDPPFILSLSKDAALCSSQ